MTSTPFARALLACGLALAATHSVSQQYPSRPIRLVIPFAPGGLVDVPGRVLAQKLTDALGQPVIVENRAGAGSTIGADHVAKSKPDGYTLMITSTTHVISANLYRAASLRCAARLRAGNEAHRGALRAGGQSRPQGGKRRRVGCARERPGRIDYASSGNGSSQHLVAALFCAMAGAPLNHVPYKGSDRATQDLIGGQVMVGFVGTPIALPHVKSGRLRALGVSTATRSPQMPEVPTLAEAGVPGFEATIWIGLFAPAGTPSEILARLHAEISRVLTAPEARAQIAATGVDVSLARSEDFTSFVRSEHAKWGKVVGDTGATVN